MKYEQHEIGKIMPKMTTEEFNSLQEDIIKNGLQTPIILFEEKVLDGWHRYTACINNNIEPRFENYTGDSPYSKVMSLNMERRHLTSGQKTCLAVEFLPFIQKEQKKNNTLKYINVLGGYNPPIIKSNRSIDKAAKLFQVSDKSIKTMNKIKQESPEIYSKVKNGGYTIADAQRNVKKIEHVKKIEIAKLNPQKNDYQGPYDLILADPCWKYDFSETKNREIENQYETASVKDIISHKPNSSKDSILFLWATAPKLLEAIQVLMAWGFTYTTHAVWNKEIIGMGYWFRGQHELLLVGTKGAPKCPFESNRVSSIFTERRTEHSKKPECVYKWIEETFPDKSKLEMYCRSPRPNWSITGNEVGLTLK